MDNEDLEKRLSKIEMQQKTILANQVSIMRFQRNDTKKFQLKILKCWNLVGGLLIFYALIDFVFGVIPTFL